MKKKKKISVQTIIEVMIRAVFFIIYPALFSTAFTGIKLIVEQITQRASLQWNSFVQTLVVLLVFTIVFGRFFCGFACAFGTWGDFVYFISSMIRKKKEKRNR
ncbi:MAG: 4Fe-4S binding protein [Anaerobutyricum hallii]